MSEGCSAVFLGQNLSDRALLAAGNYVKRAGTQAPSNAGQAGFALKHTVDTWGTEFGVYAAQFHSRSSFYSAIKGSRATDPIYVSGDPGDLNAKYFTEFPEDIRIFGATFDTRFRWGAVFGEFTYRPNQPLQYNSADLIAGFTSLTAPTPLRAQANAVAPGAVFHGWERFDAVQLQIGATGQIPNVLGAVALNLGAEIVYKGVPDLPDPTVVRFGRSDVFGQGPVNGVCPPPAAPTQCSFDGYVSKHAFGYRLRAGLLYANVIGRRRPDPVGVLLPGRLRLVGRRRDSAGADDRRRLAAGQFRQGLDGRDRLAADLGRHVQQPARPKHCAGQRGIPVLIGSTRLASPAAFDMCPAHRSVRNGYHASIQRSLHSGR